MSGRRVAAIQMASGPNLAANLLEAERLIAEAAAQGARLVVLPENFALMGLSERDKLAVREPEGDGPLQSFLAAQARRHGVWLVGGTIPLAALAPEKARAAALVYDGRGERVARYDKLHLFDVDLVESEDQRYVESETLEPGERVVVLDSPFGRMGLAVCYDLRFPELFRQMADEGMELLVVPAAFTAITGKAHWEILLRARAIENLVFVVAAGQGGFHASGRATHGHSMIVDPWGGVLAERGGGSGVVAAELDLERQRAIRRRFPALDHRRLGRAAV